MAIMNFCPSCGSPQAGGANFCIGCGYKLDSINVPAPSEMTPPSEPSWAGQFDQSFTSCMNTKLPGYEVPEGALPKLKALLPYFQERAKHGTIAGIVVESLKLAEWETPPGWADLLSVLGQEAYANAPFEHAVIDCAIRAASPGSNPVTRVLDNFPVPDPPPPPPMRQQLPVQLPPPPPAWQPMVVPMSDPAPAKPKSGGSGKAIGGAVGALVTGGAVLFVVMHLAAPNTFNVISDPVVTPPSIAVTAAGPYACKTTIHGGYVYEVNCTSSVTLHVSGNVPGTGVNVLMDMPNGTMHGSAAVRAGFRGTIKVALTVQEISSTCTAYPSYPTTAYVYDGMVVNTGPLLASGSFTYKLGCK